MKTRPLVLALVLAVASLPAAAQRASLADRVAVLEQRAANTQANVELLNQFAQLRTEVQALRAMVEELQQANEQLRNSQRTQYLDVDGRLQRLETQGAGAGAAGSTAAPARQPATTAGARATSAASGMRAAPARPVDAQPVAAALPTGEERRAYDAAFDALKAGRYADSARLFTAFLDRHPGGVYAPNALYWLGESYYVTQNYTLALEAFEQLLDRFPTHDKAPGALLKVGLSRLGLRQEDAAQAAFADVVARYPGSDAARLAGDRLQAARGAR
ncbi:MAG: tol-pal system protein YbgF [Pseudomonadota bacterium]